MKRKFSLQTAESCNRWLVILLCIILVCSLLAQLISSKGGSIKIERIMIDPRGAELSGDLYYPSGTTDEDSYPAVILAPGAGVVKENMRGFAEELARRGYVVFNLNPYGSGLSETPVYNENDMGILKYDIFATPLGVLDAVNYLRTVEFVDAARIGLSGHSQGSRRTGYAGLMDCGYYTFNDIQLILLNETFGQEISAEDVELDANAVAEERLTPEELAIFFKLSEEYKASYDNMVRSLCLIGSQAQYCNPTAVVSVAGNEVTRTCKVNECVINGQYDYSYLGFNNAPETKEAWYIDPAEDIINEAYYSIDDMTSSSKVVGMFRQDSINNNQSLKEAIENRTLRIVMQTRETHSKNFFSPQTTARVIDYFNQTLNNNPDKLSTAKSEIVFVWRELLNFIAMLAMVAFIIPLLAKLKQNEKFNVGVLAENKEIPPYVGTVIIVLTIVFGFLAIYFTNGGKTLITFKTNLAFPLMITGWTTPKILTWLALASVVLVAIYVAITRDLGSIGDFFKSNFKIGIGSILRAAGSAVVFIALGYLALSISEYFFGQDFRFWMTAFAELKANQWMYVFNYAVLMIPFFFVISVGMNYLSNKTLAGKSEGADILITVVVNSLGLWLCCFVNYALAYWGLKTDNLFSSFILSYGAMLLVPINNYIIRKSYKATNSVWFGTIACSILAAWHMVSVSGMNGSYIPTTWLSNFLGF